MATVPAHKVEPYRKLWMAVLKEAMKNAEGKGPRLHPMDQTGARAWIGSNDDGPGSYLWVCQLTGISPELPRSAID